MMTTHHGEGQGLKSPVPGRKTTLDLHLLNNSREPGKIPIQGLI